jgi:DNA-binding CsgD family transcriptional regulator
MTRSLLLRRAPEGTAPLTPRQQAAQARYRQIADLCRAGHSDAEVAQMLGVGQRYVKEARLKAGFRRRLSFAHRAQSDALSGPDALTPRERDVANLVCEGLEVKEIARELHIGYHTVKMHLRGTKAKLGVRNQLEVILVLLGRTPRSWRTEGREA